MRSVFDIYIYIYCMVIISCSDIKLNSLKFIIDCNIAKFISIHTYIYIYISSYVSLVNTFVNILCALIVKSLTGIYDTSKT